MYLYNKRRRDEKSKGNAKLMSRTMTWQKRQTIKRQTVYKTQHRKQKSELHKHLKKTVVILGATEGSSDPAVS